MHITSYCLAPQLFNAVPRFPKKRKSVVCITGYCVRIQKKK